MFLFYVCRRRRLRSQPLRVPSTEYFTAGKTLFGVGSGADLGAYQFTYEGAAYGLFCLFYKTDSGGEPLLVYSGVVAVRAELEFDAVLESTGRYLYGLV